MARLTRIVLVAGAMALVAGSAGCKPDAQTPSAAGSAAATPQATRPTTSAPSVSARPTSTRSPAAASASSSPKVSSPTPAPAATSGLTTATFRTAVPARPVTVSVKEMGPIRQNARVGGRDNGQSTKYGNRSVWIFDDTTLQKPWGFLSNSAAVTDDLDAGDGIDLRSSNGVTIDETSTPRETIPRTAAEKAFEKAHAAPAGGCAGSDDEYCGATFGFWPGPVVADQARHRVLFTYGKLCRGGRSGTPCSGSLGKGLGMGIAALDMNSGTVTRLEATGGPTVSSIEGKDATIFFGPGSKAAAGSGAALVVGDDAYLYGQCDYFDCALARVPLAAIADRSAWRYYDGSGFGADPGAAKKTGAQPGAAGNTVFYSPALKAYVDVYMPYGSNEVWYRVGGAPYGPWSGGTRILKTAGDSGHPDYALFGHAEFAERDGLVQYLSYFDGATGAQHLIRWEMTAG
ncbi:hypothetical protein ACWKSP_39315 [Micromonosporaceae bacterium Da 78-11]